MTDSNIHKILFDLQRELEDLSSAKVQMEEFRSAASKVVEGTGNIQDNLMVHIDSLKADYEKKVNHLETRLSDFLSVQKEVGESAIQDLVKSSDEAISLGLDKFSAISDKIEASNEAKILAIKKLLEHYSGVVEASQSLISTLNAIDFPAKLDAISTRSQLIIESVNGAKQALELKLHENHNSLIDQTRITKEQIIEFSDSHFQTLTNQETKTRESLIELFNDNSKRLDKQQDGQVKEMKRIKVLTITAVFISLIGIIATLFLKIGG
jgi:hypothetical protein